MSIGCSFSLIIWRTAFAEGWELSVKQSYVVRMGMDKQHHNLRVRQRLAGLLWAHPASDGRCNCTIWQLTPIRKVRSKPPEDGLTQCGPSEPKPTNLWHMEESENNVEEVAEKRLTNDRGPFSLSWTIMSSYVNFLSRWRTDFLSFVLLPTVKSFFSWHMRGIITAPSVVNKH